MHGCCMVAAKLHIRAEIPVAPARNRADVKMGQIGGTGAGRRQKVAQCESQRTSSLNPRILASRPAFCG